jgi:hypothetical protein
MTLGLSFDCTHRFYSAFSFRLGIDQIRQCPESTRVDLYDLIISTSPRKVEVDIQLPIPVPVPPPQSPHIPP